MRGRKPKPTQLKVVNGNPGRRPLNKNEPKVEAVQVIRVPAYLNHEEKTRFRQKAKELKAAKIFTKLDTHALGRWAEAQVRWEKAKAKYQESGSLVSDTPNGSIQQNIYVGIMNRAHDQLGKLEAEFGMTPSSRSRIQVVTRDDPKNRFEKYKQGD